MKMRPTNLVTSYMALAWLPAAIACDDANLLRPALDAGVDAAVGVDAGPGCPADRRFCDGSTLYACGPDGMERTRLERCAEACDPVLGCVTCIPGAGRCDGTVSTRCAPDGSRFDVVRDCAESAVSCRGSGYCDDACGDAEQADSNLGCRFLAAPLVTTPGVPFTGLTAELLVANPGPDDAPIEIRRGTSYQRLATVPPGEVGRFVLPWIPDMSFHFYSTGSNIDNLESFMNSTAAYELRTRRPVAAFQFNTYGNVAPRGQAYVNTDASTLIPVHVLGGDHVGLTAVPFSSTNDGYRPAYLALVAIEDVTATVVPSADVLAEVGGAWPAVRAGEPFEIELRAGDVAHLLAPQPPRCLRDRPYRIADHCNELDYDLTGTRVRADGPLGVFGGHLAAAVPFYSDTGTRLEAQLPPRHTWGTDHVAVPLVHIRNPSLAPVSLLRIVASMPDTEVRIEPAPEGFSPHALGPDEVLEVLIEEAVTVRGTGPILVGQFLAAELEPDLSSSGAPSMSTLPPVEQYRNDYVFASPESYDSDDGLVSQNYVLLVRPTGVPIELDGDRVEADWKPVGDDHEWAIVFVRGGAHHARADAPFGVMVYGMGFFTSYFYMGGGDLRPIALR